MKRVRLGGRIALCGAAISAFSLGLATSGHAQPWLALAGLLVAAAALPVLISGSRQVKREWRAMELRHFPFRNGNSGGRG